MATTQYDDLIDIAPPLAAERALHRLVWLAVLLAGSAGLVAGACGAHQGSGHACRACVPTS